MSDPSKIIPGSYADWANYSLGSNNGTYPKPTVGPDYEALDEARAYALERFLRGYDEYCDWKRRSTHTDGQQLELWLEAYWPHGSWHSSWSLEDNDGD